MTQTLTTERLREIASSPSFSANPLSHEVKYMARELLANREAQPVGFYTTVSGKSGVIWHNGAPEDDTAIYTAPPAPAAPDAINTAIRYLKDTLVACNRFNYCADAVNRVENACRAAMLAQPVSQGCNWIACSEKMPEPNKYVQVSNGVWVGIGMYNDAEHFEDDERWQDEHNEFIDLLHHPVTHWMPLPAAPEGGNEK
ncbi:Protein of uncharacterised function (DUF551) [Serratia quinivorans]|uniref:DUF551 domain-containing protein n=1 Tax=Serratia quinivorans TaxID=137545 RepID=UPI002179F0FB|nr:DUF551 domain-containing protein [Serratia quinivorans]CAI0710857.1 Protein of uncharacterised function (DUF551) [Serratia quinivorans]